MKGCTTATAVRPRAAHHLSSSDLQNEGRSFSRSLAVTIRRSGRLSRINNPASPSTTVKIRSIEGIVIFSLAPSAVTRFQVPRPFWYCFGSIG
jgi:hypothetical protein